MKNRTVEITSLSNHTLVTVFGCDKKNPSTYRFGSVDDAIEFVLPRGNRHTRLYLNGNKIVLYGWVQ